MQSQAAIVSTVLLLLTLYPTSANSTVTSPVPVTEDSTASLSQTVRQIQRDNADLRRDNAAMKRDITGMRRDNAALRLELSQLQGMMLRYLDIRPTGSTSTPDPPRNTSSGGATYVRWGRRRCPPETDLVYKGYTGGSRHTDPGAAAEHLCLPEEPEYASSASVFTGARVYGAEYNAYHIFHNANHDVPCAVCRSSTRSSAIMVPARTSCYPGFHLEYDGYLMAGYRNHTAATEFVCVDRSPQNVAGGARDQEGKQLYFVESRCGSLKCPPYVEGRAMTCAVCSK